MSASSLTDQDSLEDSDVRAVIDNISHNSGFELIFDLSFPDAFGWIHEIDLRVNTSANYYSMKPVAMLIFFPEERTRSEDRHDGNTEKVRKILREQNFRSNHVEWKEKHR